ncbi:cation diffusion facilitator family transporter [Parapusillimonas granuli]|uniref:Cation transporter n=1 Tax=Parapusillimonas granuli TaxID=380911 RepID=A0A853G3K6_9BURK|nr:cation diffusion facilitator family transporter [Parapusillimonas granuli]MEB2398392.1 cation diffusion facilitator family transporter [Alcaligenaceae bacterium]NYT49590.1 cation transporter [Parapusillimonas granuli]
MVSVLVNVLLTAVQFSVGLFAHSQALVADALHSLSDLLSDGVVLFANRHSQKAPDAEHPYGHHRFETAASLAVGAMLLAVGAGMLWSSFTTLQTPADIPEVHGIALAIALLTLLGKELLFRYLLRVARRVRSSMLAANAWHARSDAASSLVVAIGIVANLAGFHLADPLAALVVGLMIIRMGWKFFYSAFNDLTDAAVDDQTEERIRRHLITTPGVHNVHGLKTRKMGDMIWVEVDLEMDGRLTIEEGHAIAVEARRRVMEHEPVLDVTTHFDPVRIDPVGIDPVGPDPVGAGVDESGPPPR